MSQAQARQSSKASVSPGEFARDVEQIDDPDEDDLVIVLEETGKPISETVVYEEPDGTVHTADEWNDDEHAGDLALKAVYKESVERRFGGSWTVADVQAAYEDDTLEADRGSGGYGITVYVLPAGRLQAIGE